MLWSIPLVAIFTLLYAVSVLRARRNVDVLPGRIFYANFFISLLMIGIAFFCLWTRDLTAAWACMIVFLVFGMGMNYYTFFVFAERSCSKPALYIVSSAGIVATFIALIILYF